VIPRVPSFATITITPASLSRFCISPARACQTQDRRKELSKKVSKMGEDGKVAVRNVRKDAMKRLDKHDFPKDSRKDLEDSIQKITDRYVKAVDDLIKTKSEELMKV
jgi:ribosome recycling factor